MPERKDNPTDGQSGNEEGMSRRKLLQVSGVGLSAGALATAGASANSDDESFPNTIFFDGTVSSESSTYELLVDSTVEPHTDIGPESGEWEINGGHLTGSVEQETHAFKFSGTVSYLDVDGAAEVRIIYGEGAHPDRDRLELVATSDGDVDYEIETIDTAWKVTDNGDRSADDGDSIRQNDDGTWTIDGSTENGYGDTYDLSGEITQIEPVEGEFTLFFNGEETTVSDLTGQDPPEEEDEESETDREHSYTFEATGEEDVDYYFEVEDGGNLIASELGGAVVDGEDRWLNEDGTKAAGRIQPGDSHAYEFDTTVADVTIEGEANAFVNGSESNLEIYPQESASGDHWKGYFPWQIEGEEREHRYAFEATGEEYVDYYLEIEDSGDLIPSTVDDAIVEYEYFWISDDETKAAGRIQPGDSHAYEFDTLVADVTIEGEADAFVNGSESNLEIYPQESATGEDWKTGFPWQDDDHEPPGDEESDTSVGIRHDRYDGPLGGGDGIPSRLVYDTDDVDIVVNDGDVDSALNSASAGDVIYIEGSASGFQADVPDVTIAGNRGHGSDGEVTGEITVTADDITFSGLTLRPGSGTALTIQAQHPVFYNCAVLDASDNCIQIRRSNTAATFTQCRFANWSGYGIHHVYDGHDEEHKIIVEYCEFEDLGRHGIAAGNAWYHIADCYMHGSIQLEPDHFIEVRAPNEYGVDGSAPVECGSPSGNAIIEHNRHELTGGGQKTRLAVVRGEPTDGVWVRNNVAPDNAAPTGGCWQDDTHGGWGTQLVFQNASSTDEFSSVEVEHNER